MPPSPALSSTFSLPLLEHTAAAGIQYRGMYNQKATPSLLTLHWTWYGLKPACTSQLITLPQSGTNICEMQACRLDYPSHCPVAFAFIYKAFFSYSSFCSVSKEHLVVPSISVAFFPFGVGNLHDRGHYFTIMAREVIAGTHCCTMTSDNSNARMAWGATVTSDRISEKWPKWCNAKNAFWNISEFQRVHLSSVVYIRSYQHDLTYFAMQWLAVLLRTRIRISPQWLSILILGFVGFLSLSEQMRGWYVKICHGCSLPVLSNS